MIVGLHFHSFSVVITCRYIYRTTILAAVAFLDAFQKVADMATNSRGKIKGYISVTYKSFNSETRKINKG